jgi:hypothetical protein
MRKLLATALFLLMVSPAFALPPQVSPPPTPTVGPGPCDLTANGCIDYWSVIERGTRTYTGPLFTLYRQDGQTRQIGSLPGSLMVDMNAIHKFCDGYDCFFQYLYDEINPHNTLSQTIVGQMPILQWAANGLPRVVMDGRGNNPYGSGQYLVSTSPTGLPTTQSRTMYTVGSNFRLNPAATSFVSYGQLNTQPVAPGDIWAPTAMLDAPNTHNFIYGNDLDINALAYGAYQPGYSLIVGLTKFDASDNNIFSSVITTPCSLVSVQSCNAYTTYNGTPPATVNTGNGYPNQIQGGVGTDAGTYGNDGQTAMLLNYATTPAEDSAVMQQLAQVHLASRPSSCATTATTFSATKPLPVFSTPVSYYGLPTLNVPSLQGLWSPSLLNPDYTGPLFRVRRADNGTTYDIYPSGCDYDKLALGADLSGTTGTFVYLYDQSGHGWTMQQPTVVNQPAVALTGMNGGLCAQFTPATSPNSSFMVTSKDIWSHPGSSPTLPGLAQNMTVEAVFQTTSSVANTGTVLSMPNGGWQFGGSSTPKLNYSHPAGADLTYSAPWSFNVPHFTWITADAAATQNLIMGIDGNPTLAGTTTNQPALASGYYYELGGTGGSGSIGAAFQGCISMAAIYNDIESSGNIAAAQAMAQQKWATP